MFYTDCNYCPMISMTEARQKLVKRESDLPLICVLSGKQLEHSGKIPMIEVPDDCPLNVEINYCSSMNKIN